MATRKNNRKQLNGVGDQLELDVEIGTVLPSPKRRSANNTIDNWAKFYTSFSIDFASAALDHLEAKSGDCLIDPFMGAGTTAVAAQGRVKDIIGIDLDPYSNLVTRARVASDVDANLLKRYLKVGGASNRLSGFEYSDETRDLFTPKDIEFAQGVYDRLVKRTGIPKVNILQEVLDDSGGAYDTEAVALCALATAARDSAKIIGSSNPVWVRKSLRGEKPRRQPLPRTSSSRAKEIRNDIESDAKESRSRVRLFNQDINQTIPKSKKASLFLTSPPYMNRLDYVVMHLPQISILEPLTALPIEQLKKKMIGTTKIVNKRQSIPVEWGPECLAILELIRKHQSKASATYYYWTFVQYFEGLFNSISFMHKHARSNARGLFVVQDSYYKDIKLPIEGIVFEMADSLGIRCSTLRSDHTSAHLGALSPSQRGYVPRKILTEYVIRMDFHS